jgi:DNA (cytosine-5)-methyltransferase 1
MQTADPWADFRIVHCLDGKARRLGAGIVPLAHGIPANVGDLIAELCRMGESAKSAKQLIRQARRHRRAQLAGYGNAIVPHVAAVFVRAVMEEIESTQPATRAERK